MPQQVRGVIARSKGAPVEIVPVTIPDPGANEVVVAIAACGVCHTDLTYRDGGINDEYPFLLGHEASGIVESVGPGVTMSRWATSSSSTGVLCVGSVVPVSADARSTASTRSTPSRR